jgi:hypothetical protein
MKSTKLAILALTTALAATTAPAQWFAASGGLNRTRGNSDAQSAHDIYGVLVSSPQHAYAGFEIDNGVRLFGQTRDGGAIDTEAYTNTRYGTSRAALTVGGSGRQLVDSLTTSLVQSHQLFFVNIFPIDPQITVMIGFMPVTLSGNAGVLLSTGLTLSANLGSNAVSITGTTYSALYGAARVMVGFSFAGAGVEARLELGRAQLSASASARTGSITTNATASLTAVALRIVAFVQLFVRLGEVTLVDVAGPTLSLSGSNFLN